MKDLEGHLEKNGINIPPCKLPAPNALSPPICLPSSAHHGKCIKQEPSEELIGSFSPSSTPQVFLFNRYKYIFKDKNCL